MVRADTLPEDREAALAALIPWLEGTTTIMSTQAWQSLVRAVEEAVADARYWREADEE